MNQYLITSQSMNRGLPIGVFDSGLGGLTVLKELHKILPNENFIYFGDTARVPYGNKSPKIVIKYSTNITKFLIKKQIKLLVVACNTASAVALHKIKEQFSIPIIDVIEPCVKKAAHTTKTNTICILGTQTTIASNAYQDRLLKHNSKIKVIAQHCNLLVPLIEEGLLKHEITKQAIKMYLSNFSIEETDTMILGCTHYPLIKKQIINMLEKKINIIDSSITTAQYIKKYLLTHKLTQEKKANQSTVFYVTDAPKHFKKQANLFLKNPIKNIINIEL